jgi:Ala-tRNA(Pro) deacylase
VLKENGVLLRHREGDLGAPKEESTVRVLDYLSENGIDFSVMHHQLHYTAQEEAAAQHISGHRFAKTVVVRADDEYILLALPASHRIDFKLLKGVLGTDVELAAEGDLARLFPDCDVGAEPPFGSQYGLHTIVDDGLAAQERIAVRAGSHTEVVLLSYADYARLEKPQVASFTRPEA